MSKVHSAGTGDCLIGGKKDFDLGSQRDPSESYACIPNEIVRIIHSYLGKTYEVTAIPGSNPVEQVQRPK
jgi:hypothetical protein